MKQELEQKLIQNFPIVYRDMYGNPRNTCMAFGIECNDGWFQILWDLSAKLEEIAKKEPLPPKHTKFKKLGWKVITKLNDIKYKKEETNKSCKKLGDLVPDKIYFYFMPKDDERLKFDQIKEKFGELRAYLSHYTEEADEAVEEATNKSLQTCEDCGFPAKLRNNGGWLITLCDKHWEGYKAARK